MSVRKLITVCAATKQGRVFREGFVCLLGLHKVQV